MRGSRAGGARVFAASRAGACCARPCRYFGRMTLPPPLLLRRFARVLRRARAERGMSVAGLARAAGLPRVTLEAMEAGRRSPTLVQLVALARALGCEADALVAATLAPRARKARGKG